MLLYLTGASSSLKRSEESPQADVSKSLGGYVSSSLVPNGALNSLFDLISITTLKDKRNEIVGIALVNKFDFDVKNVTLKIVTSDTNIAKFKVAATALGEDMSMEHIANRYSEPMMAEFVDAEFYPASVDVTIENLGVSGEEIHIEPFDKFITISEPTYDGFYNSVEKAFSNDSKYSVRRISEKVFRIESKDTSVSIPMECSYLSEGTAAISFDDLYKIRKDNSVLLIEELKSGEGIGLWLKREISEVRNKSYSELIENYDKKLISDTLEEIELLIEYNDAADYIYGGSAKSESDSVSISDFNELASSSESEEVSFSISDANFVIALCPINMNLISCVKTGEVSNDITDEMLASISEVVYNGKTLKMYQYRYKTGLLYNENFVIKFD